LGAALGSIHDVGRGQGRTGHVLIGVWRDYLLE
jgi:hypothetical protein